MRISEEFKQYAYFSVRVDRFFHLANTYGYHHNGLKSLCEHLPNHEIRQNLISSETTGKELKRYLQISSFVLEPISHTGIFADSQGEDIGQENMGQDALNFSFYTCFCFQWNLFENFVKRMIRKAMDSAAIPQSTCEKLKKLWKNTKQFMDFINSGEVFGESPFITILPVKGWQPEIEKCNIKDLHDIRELRNKFTHAVETPEITAEGILEKQDRYERSMWILRKFAENIQNAVVDLIDSKSNL